MVVVSVVPDRSKLQVGRPTLSLVDRALLKEALSEYEYVSPPRSLLEQLYLVAFWDRVADTFPVWLAPNTVTFVGYLCSLAAMALTLAHSPTVDGSAPAWLYPTCALLLWVYQTADGSDGPQARRLRCGSALGELFDHGVDAVVTSLVSFVCLECIAIGLAFPLVPLLLAATHLAFYFSNITLLHCGKQHFNMFDAQVRLSGGWVVVGLVVVVAVGWGLCSLSPPPPVFAKFTPVE